MEQWSSIFKGFVVFILWLLMGSHDILYIYNNHSEDDYIGSEYVIIAVVFGYFTYYLFEKRRKKINDKY